MKKTTSRVILFLLLSCSQAPANTNSTYNTCTENSVQQQKAKTIAWGLVGALTVLLGIKDIAGSYGTISVDKPEVTTVLNEQAFKKFDNELANNIKNAKLTERDVQMIYTSTTLTKDAAVGYMKQLLKLSLENEKSAQFYRGLVFSLLSAYSFQKSYENYNELYNVKANVSTQVLANGSLKSSAQITLQI